MEEDPVVELSLFFDTVKVQLVFLVVLLGEVAEDRSRLPDGEVVV